MPALRIQPHRPRASPDPTVQFESHAAPVRTLLPFGGDYKARVARKPNEILTSDALNA
jgi:hypothetical protein